MGTLGTEKRGGSALTTGEQHWKDRPCGWALQPIPHSIGLRAEALLLAGGLQAETFLTNSPVLTQTSCSAQGKGLRYYFALWNLFRV